MFFSHLVMSFLVGFVFSMAFESPFIALEKIIFGYAGSQSQPAGKNERSLKMHKNITESKLETNVYQIFPKSYFLSRKKCRDYRTELS